MSVNRCICTGNLTRDPELRELPSGNVVCELRLAVDGMGRAGGPGFIDVNVYGKPGEAAAAHLARGWLVAVDGRLDFREWEPAPGEKRHDYTLVGNVEFLSAPAGADGPLAPPRRREPVAA